MLLNNLKQNLDLKEAYNCVYLDKKHIDPPKDPEGKPGVMGPTGEPKQAHGGDHVRSTSQSEPKKRSTYRSAYEEFKSELKSYHYEKFVTWLNNLQEEGYDIDKWDPADIIDTYIKENNLWKSKEIIHEAVEELDEAGKKCWPGYKKKGTQKIFGKTYNRCVKEEGAEEVEQIDEISANLALTASQKADEERRKAALAGNTKRAAKKAKQASDLYAGVAPRRARERVNNSYEPEGDSVDEGVADRAKAAVTHQRQGTHGDDHEMGQLQSATDASIARMKKKTSAYPNGFPAVKKEETELDEAGKKCWPGYKKKGTQKIFGKTYNRCVKEEEVEIDEAARNPYAIGTSVAMKSTGDTPPLKKSTIEKAHEIAKKIETREAVDSQSSLSSKQRNTEQQQTLNSKVKLEKILAARKGQYEEIEIDELNRYEKETGKDLKTGKSVTKGGTLGGDDTHSKVMRHMHNVMGAGRMGAGGAIQPRGKKKDRGGPTPGPTRTPAQTVAKRRADAQRAQDMMHSPRD